MSILLRRIALLIIVCFTFSCKPKQENAATKTIDSLLTALDDAEDKLETINFEKLESAAKTAAESLEKAKPLIVDTLNRDKIFLMSNYAIVSGEEEEAEQTSSNHSGDYEEEREGFIEKEINFCKKQLKNLKNDFAKGEMDLPTFKKYFEVERDKSLQIILFIDMEKNASSHRLALFDSLHPVMLKFIDSLQTASSKKK